MMIKGFEEREKMQWNHTASLMALYANSKAQKGKRYQPEDFHPFEAAKKEAERPKTRDDVNKLIQKNKSFNGKQ